MKKRAADLIVDTLAARGITQSFAVVGGGAMYLDNALGRCDAISKIFNHHEQACAMAAEAYARMAKKPAAVFVTSGPGATNAITGVLGAWVDSVPMLVISGQVRQAISVEASGLPLRYRGVQECDIVSAVKGITKYAKKITDPLSVRREVNKALDIAMSGRRGPVWLDVPLDTQSAQIEPDELYPDEAPPAEPTAGEGDARFVWERLREARRPVILAGSGVAAGGCAEQLRAMTEAWDIPVVGACLDADVMYLNHRRFYGMSGVIGPRPGNFILQNADLILSIGSSLGFQATGFAQEQFAPKAFLISVDADPYEPRKPGLRVGKAVHATARSFLDRLCACDPLAAPKEWLEYCDRLKARFTPYEAAEGAADEERVSAYRFWRTFDRLAPDGCVLALGPNTANSARLQIGAIQPSQRLVTNKNCGSMGACLPFAIGAAAAGASVICSTGDGSLMMNLQEMQTIRHYRLPIKLVVFENDGYNAIRQTSNNYFNGYYVGCNAKSGVSFPDFSALAKTFGFSYRRCGTNGELEESISWLLESKEPIFLEVSQRLDDPVLPKVMSRPSPDGSIQTPALEDMFPFLPEEEQSRWMLD